MVVCTLRAYVYAYVTIIGKVALVVIDNEEQILL